MKKFTLTLAACLMVLGSLAQNVAKKTTLNGAQLPASVFEKKGMKLIGNSCKVAPHQKLSLAAENIQALSANIRKVKAKEEGEGISGEKVLVDSYHYDGWANLGMFPMTSDNGFLGFFQAEGMDCVLIDIWGLQYGIMGVILPSSAIENQYSSLGADSVVFFNNQTILEASSLEVQAAYTEYVENEETQTVTLTRSSAETFGGYLFRNNKELFIPGFIGCYAGESQELLTQYTDVQSHADVNLIYGLVDKLKKATIEGEVTEYDENDNATVVPVSGEYPYYRVDDCIYIQGLLFDKPEQWLKIYDSETEEYAYIGALQQIDWYGRLQNGSNVVALTGRFDENPDRPGYGSFALYDYPMVRSFDWDYNSVLTYADPSMMFVAIGLYSGADNALGVAGALSFTEKPVITLKNDLYIPSNGGDDDETGISFISGNSNIATKEYFDLSGRKVENTAKGLVIEKVRYTDGKTVSRKVVK